MTHIFVRTWNVKTGAGEVLKYTLSVVQTVPSLPKQVRSSKCVPYVLLKKQKENIIVTVTKLHASKALEACLSTYSVAVSHEYSVPSFAAL
jgi:hypothetical protein